MTLERLQGLFNTVKVHLLSQKEKSLKPAFPGDTACRYRGDGGLKCAVGCLIKDEYYSESLEGIAVTVNSSIGTQYKAYNVIKAIEDSLGYTLSKAELTLLSSLQDIHDDNTVESWKDALDSLEGRLEYIYKMYT